MSETDRAENHGPENHGPGKHGPGKHGPGKHGPGKHGPEPVPAPHPAAAERARTLAYGVADGVLATPGAPCAPVPAHAADRNGRPLLLMPATSPAVAALAEEPDLPATLRLCDVAPVPLPDRVRGRAWMRGRLTGLAAGEHRAAALRLSRVHPRPELLDVGSGQGSEWTILALEVAEIEIEDAWGRATPGPGEYAAAAPDPFVAIEAGVLTHLDSCHRSELTMLLPGMVTGAAPPVPLPVVRPLALDRHGMWLRCRIPEPGAPGDADPFDLRLAFAEPVSDVHGLRCVYRRLLTPTAT